MNLNSSFNSNIKFKKSENNEKIKKNNLSTSFLAMTHLNYEIVSVKKNDTNDKLKNDIIILMKQLKIRTTDKNFTEVDDNVNTIPYNVVNFKMIKF